MLFSRCWSISNADTFLMCPVQELLSRYIKPDMQVVDPFARNALYGTRTNDLNPKTKAQDHMPADEWMEKVVDEGVLYDCFLLDPPYSSRQVKEVYQGFGRTVTQEDTQQRFLTKVKDSATRLLKPDGVTISFGWNSIGMGKTRGFVIVEIMLISHGRHKNDTIVTVERRESY